MLPRPDRWRDRPPESVRALWPGRLSLANHCGDEEPTRLSRITHDVSFQHQQRLHGRQLSVEFGVLGL
jgi:hypothetical protein